MLFIFFSEINIYIVCCIIQTREREQCLKEQLTDANSKIQEWLAKLSETENKLQLKTQELKYAQDTIQQLEVGYRMLGQGKIRSLSNSQSCTKTYCTQSIPEMEGFCMYIVYTDIFYAPILRGEGIHVSMDIFLVYYLICCEQ